MPAGGLGVPGRGVEACADGRGAQVDLVDQLDRLGEAAAVLVQHHGERRELLAEGHGHRVLELGAAHLQHVAELDGLAGEGVLEDGHRLEQAAHREHRRDLDGGRVDVVGGLAEVDVLVGVQVCVLPLGVPEQLQRAVGHDLVGVHVGGRARAALDDVHDELVVQLAGAYLPAGGDDRVGLLGRQQAEFRIGEGGGLLDCGQGVDQVRVGGDGGAGDGEVLRRAQGVDAPVRVGGHVTVAEQVVFASGGRGHESTGPRFCGVRGGAPEGARGVVDVPGAAASARPAATGAVPERPDRQSATRRW